MKSELNYAFSTFGGEGREQMKNGFLSLEWTNRSRLNIKLESKAGLSTLSCQSFAVDSVFHTHQRKEKLHSRK